MTFVHHHSKETGLLFQQEAKMSGRIADELAPIAEELVVLIIQETTERDFSKHLFSNHLTLPSGRRPNRSASPGSSEAAARDSPRNRSLRASGPTVRIVRDSHSTTAGVHS
jgi:hypothetical protein